MPAWCHPGHLSARLSRNIAAGGSVGRKRPGDVPGSHGRRIMKIDIGIDEAQREEIAAGLSKVMADTYSLYLKTHGFHWNVTGPMFNTLHLMFEEEYNELWAAVDLIAERIRALGVYAPGSYAQLGDEV